MTKEFCDLCEKEIAKNHFVVHLCDQAMRSQTNIFCVGCETQRINEFLMDKNQYSLEIIRHFDIRKIPEKIWPNERGPDG